MPATVHRIGAPENASELAAIRHLAEELPPSYLLFHNFELVTERGLPYEYDIAVVAPHAVYHVEVKGYRGELRGDANQWVSENGSVQPSPVPLALRKTRLLASKLRAHTRLLSDAACETVILLTDPSARPRIRDASARVIRLEEALAHLTDPRLLPAGEGNIAPFRSQVVDALFALRPSKKVERIGLYDVVEKIGQTDERTVFLAKHRHVKTRPFAILKVFHVDPYAGEEEKARRIAEIFHDQNAIRLLGAHPHLIDTHEFFDWGEDRFVLPTEFLEGGRPLDAFLAEDRDASLTFGAKVDIVAKVAQGLRHAHAHGVIHRDIRPRNIVVAPEGVVKLVNFDLALIKGASGLLDAASVRARIDRVYVAPEVFQDPPRASERSDIYSLGLVLYELLAGRRAYEDIQDVLVRGRVPLDLERLEEAIARPSGGAARDGTRRFRRAARDVSAVIARMCSLYGSERYASLDEVIEDLAIIS
jgi:hypothetical protein